MDHNWHYRHAFACLVAAFAFGGLLFFALPEELLWITLVPWVFFMLLFFWHGYQAVRSDPDRDDDA